MSDHIATTPMLRDRSPVAETRATGADCTPAQFWWRHVRVPLLLAASFGAVAATTPVDAALARALFFDGVHWLGGTSWWTNEALHTGGRYAMRLVGIAAIMVWGAGAVFGRWRSVQRAAGFVALAILLSTGLVGLAKSLTNVDCPWDLAGFGGSRPSIRLFADRPDDLPQAACFPAAHSSSGFALVAFYFLWLGRSRRLAVAGLVAGLATGVVFGVVQQSRGAHFLSHDVASAVMVWLTCVTLYAAGYRCRLWSGRAAPRPGAPAG